MVRTATDDTQPLVRIRVNKHHTKEFYVLVDAKDQLTLPGVNQGIQIKRVGPAIIEVTQKGLDRKIVRHPLNGKTIWSLFNGYIQTGFWALNNRSVAPFLPKELLALSERFRQMDDAQRKRWRKRSSDEVKQRKQTRRRSKV